MERLFMKKILNVERLTFSIAETAEALGISSRTVHTLIKSGALPCVRIGTRVLVEVEALREFIANRKQTHKP